MQLKFIKALWGMEAMPIEAALDWVSQNGYSGFETVVDTARRAQGKHSLDLVLLAFAENADEVKRGIDEAVQLNAKLVNFQAGKDWFSFAQGCDLFEAALRYAEDCPIPVCFETHRGRILFSPTVTAEYLDRFPTLRLTADFSHWTCVCESMLSDQEAHLEKAIRAVGHVHARVGHEEGPQVPDPRAPQWHGHVQVFEGWWDRILQAAEQQGQETLFIDPEFGPPNYLWTDPRTGEPLADLLEVCNWMKNRLTKRWLA